MDFVRLIRGARHSAPFKARSEWILTNIVETDATQYLPELLIGTDDAIRLEVAANDVVVVERWAIFLGRSASEDYSATAVLAHAIHAYLRIADFYSDVHREKAEVEFTVRLQQSPTGNLDSSVWERRTWSVQDGLSVQVYVNKLWRRELSEFEGRRRHREGSYGPQVHVGSVQSETPTPPFAPASAPAIGSFGQRLSPIQPVILPPPVGEFTPPPLPLDISTLPPIPEALSPAGEGMAHGSSNEGFLAMFEVEVDAAEEGDLRSFIAMCNDFTLHEKPVDVHKYAAASQEFDASPEALPAAMHSA